MGGTDKVTTVRHRGDFDADTPENSLAAFRNSYQACRPGIETDIRKTKDGQFVLFHDTKIGKMLEPGYNPQTDTGPNATLDSLTYSQLREKNLVKIDRSVSDQKIINLDTFLTDYVNTKGRSIINLEIKSDGDVLDVVKAFDRISKRLGADLYSSTIFKFRMTAYPTIEKFQDDLVKANIPPGNVMAMPVMSAQIAESINALPPIKPGESNAYAAVDSWSDAPNVAVPSVEVVMKDAQGYKEYQYEFPYYSQTDSYLDMVPMTVPSSTELRNVREGTMAEMSELVKSRNKPLAQFVPIPDWAMWRKDFSWDTSLPNTVPNTPKISPREAYFNNDSKCCYALSDRLAGDKLDQEKADQRILLPFQERIKATVLTADDTDSIDSYFKGKGKYLDLGDNKVKPNAPNPAMNSLIFPGNRIPRATVAQTTNISYGQNQLINAQFRLCANNKSGAMQPANEVIVWECNPGDPMNHWQFRQRDAEGYGVIGLGRSEYCLNSQGRVGTTVIWPCDKATNAMWRYRSDGSIVDRATNACLSLTGDKSGSNLETEACNGSGRQQWLTDYAENSFGSVDRDSGLLLASRGTGQCLNLYGNSGTEQLYMGQCVVSTERTWGTWTGMVSGQGGYKPVLESGMKDSSGDYYMCARAPSPTSVVANSCENRSAKEYWWYFTPDERIVSVNTGGCLIPRPGSSTLLVEKCESAKDRQRAYQWG
ncbi:hypothetical protein GCM10009569_01890 [Arthrobacter russicus]